MNLRRSGQEDFYQAISSTGHSRHSPRNTTLNSSRKEKTTDLLFDSEDFETKELIGFGRLSAVYRVKDQSESTE